MCSVSCGGDLGHRALRKRHQGKGGEMTKYNNNSVSMLGIILASK